MSLDERLERLEMKTANDYGGFEETNSENIQQATQAILKDLLDIIGEDEEIPMENRMSDIEQVRLFNQLAKSVYGRNALRQELREAVRKYCE